MQDTLNSIENPKNQKIRLSVLRSKFAVNALETQNFYRFLSPVAGLVYLLWGLYAQSFFPNSYNPLGGRIGIFILTFVIFGVSFVSKKLQRNMSSFYLLVISLITLHYFYLFAQNRGSIDWAVGLFILIVSINWCFQKASELLFYFAMVATCSIVLTFHKPEMLKTVLLPGLFTVFVFSYLGFKWRHRLLEQTRDFALRVQNLFDAVFEGIVLHEQGVISDVNQAFVKIFKYDREEIIGQSLTHFFDAESSKNWFESTNFEDGHEIELQGLTKSGARIPILVKTKRQIIGGKGFNFTAVRDLSFEKASENNRIRYEAAQEAVRIRDDFISIVSHELKTPLTALKLLSDVAQRNVKRDSFTMDQAESFVVQNEKQITRLTKLVEEMLDISRIATMRLKIEKHRMNLSEAVLSVINTLQDSLAQAKCQTHYSVDSDLFIMGDRIRMEQVVVNILNNAIKYARGTPVTLRLQRSESNEIVLTISDKGMGIAKENHSRIFNKFERAVSASSVSGLGLGLYICRQIIEQHDGEIAVQSDLGEGASFRITLPRLNESEFNT